MHFYKRTKQLLLLYILSSFCFSPLHAQTDLDYDMMAKNLFCGGFQYNYSSWDHYWEGVHKRNNQNLGTVSTQMAAFMGNYGVSKKLNLLFGVPYVKTNASAGTMRGMSGLQDLSLFIKWKPYTKSLGTSKLSLIGVGGVSLPVSDYTPDHLPLSIGLRSKNIIARVIADYERNKFFITGSGSYVYRSNIHIDRTSYYTTQLHASNRVTMPNAALFNLRTGYRSKYVRAEAVLNNWTTLGGFDITKNNMPFPSNRMNATTAGVSLRVIPKALPKLTITAEGNHTIAGRNMGQSTMLSAGAFYILDFNRKATSVSTLNAN